MLVNCYIYHSGCNTYIMHDGHLNLWWVDGRVVEVFFYLVGTKELHSNTAYCLVTVDFDTMISRYFALIFRQSVWIDCSSTLRNAGWPDV